MKRSLKQRISFVLAIIMIITAFAGCATTAALEEPTESSLHTSDIQELQALTLSLATPLGMQEFADDWDSDPNEIIEIAVQFVTPSEVALRLLSEADDAAFRPFSAQSYEDQALEAHDAFWQQMAPFTQPRMRTAAPIEMISEHHLLFNGVFLRVPVHMVEQIATLPEVFAVTPQIIFQREPLPVPRGVFGPEDFMRESLELFDIEYIHGTLGFTGQGVRVAVVDTGIDYNHPEFASFRDPATGRVRGWCFVRNSANVMETDTVNSHGTHVSGTIVALAPDIELWHYSVFGEQAAIESNIIRALEAAHRDDIDVLNMSLGTFFYGNPSIHPINVAANTAVLSGIVVVVSAGNFGRIEAPGAASLTITVTSGTAGGRNDLGDQLSPALGAGPVTGTMQIKPDIIAPGTGVISTIRGGAYGPLNGTSMAAPHIAGVAALLLEAFPNASPYEVKTRIMNAARPLSHVSGDPDFEDWIMERGTVFFVGAGFVQPVRALTQTSFATVRHDIIWAENGVLSWREETMASLSFGHVFNRTESQALTLTIHQAGNENWSSSVQLNRGANSEGVQLLVTPLPSAGDVRQYTVQMNFEASAQDGVHDGNLVFTNGEQRITIPFAAIFDRNVPSYPLLVSVSAALGAYYPCPTVSEIDFGEYRIFGRAPFLPRGRNVRMRYLGDEPTGPIRVDLIGENADSFLLHRPLRSNVLELPFFVSPGQHMWQEFYIIPQRNLVPGTYRAYLVFSMENDVSRSISLQFTVLPADYTLSLHQINWDLSVEEIVWEPVADRDFGIAPVDDETHFWWPQMVRITNDGGVGGTGPVTVALSGENADRFTLNSPHTLSNIFADTSNPPFFYVMPNSEQEGLHRATVTVSTQGGVSESFEVRFQVGDTVFVSGVNIPGAGARDMLVGDTLLLTAEVLPVEATNQAVSWVSSAPAVAMVSENGEVTAVAPGTATITVTTADGGHTASIMVTVMVPPGSGSSIIQLNFDGMFEFSPRPVGDIAGAIIVAPSIVSNITPGFLVVRLTGEHASSFEFTHTLCPVYGARGVFRTLQTPTSLFVLPNIAPGEFTEAILRPRPDLLAGIHTATVEVRGGFGISETFDVVIEVQ